MTRGRGEGAPTAWQVAARCLARITDDGGYSQRVLQAELGRAELDGRDRAAVTRSVYGTLADLRAVDLALDRALDRGLVSTDPALRAYLRLGVWAATRSATGPAGPIVNAVVDAARRDGLGRQSGALNGVLRRVERDAGVIFAPPTRATAAAAFGVAHGLPDWIAERLLAQLGDDGAAQAMAALNAPTPVVVRVRGGSATDASSALASDGVEVTPHAWVPGALVCRGDVAASRAHRDGLVAIQDAGAQAVALALPRSLGAEPRLLDVCAGIGGKTRALADRYPSATLVAVDVAEAKLAGLADTPRAVPCVWRVGDEPAPAELRDTAPFDAAIVDAPCTALGTLGRHPEVRWRRSADDVRELAAVQARIVRSIMPLVRPGGWLVYTVCTWTPEETWGVLDAVGTEGWSVASPDAGTAEPGVGWDAHVDGRGALTLWPHLAATDGFFIARLRRTE